MRIEEREKKNKPKAANRLKQSIQASVESSSHSVAIGQLTVNLTVTMRPRCRQRLPGMQRRAA